MVRWNNLAVFAASLVGAVAMYLISLIVMAWAFAAVALVALVLAVEPRRP